MRTASFRRSASFPSTPFDFRPQAQSSGIQCRQPARAQPLYSFALFGLSTVSFLCALLSVGQQSTSRHANAVVAHNTLQDPNSLRAVSFLSGVFQPVLPASAVLRHRVGASVSDQIEADDATVTDSFLQGRCLYAILAQRRAPQHRFAFDKLSVEVILGTRGVTLSWPRRMWQSPPGHDQAIGILETCSDLLIDLEEAEAVFRFPGLQPARAIVPRVADPSPRGPVHSAICTMVKGTQPAHLDLFVRYHNAVGFGHVFVYVNEPWADFAGRAGAAELYTSLVRSGRATFTAWDFPRWYPGDDGGHFAQVTAANACHRRYRGSAEHLAFIDVDEFMYVREGRLLPQILPPWQPCLLLPATWAVTSELPAMTLEGLKRTELRSIGPLQKLAGDRQALFRHKLYARSQSLEVVGIHGSIAVRDLWGHPQPPPPCVYRWDKNGTNTAWNPDDIGFLHIVSPSLRSARPRSDLDPRSRNTFLIVDEITASARAYNSSALVHSIRPDSTPPVANFLTALPHAILRGRSSPATASVSSSSIGLGDLVIADAFLAGHCLIALMPQHMDPRRMHNYSRLSISHMSNGTLTPLPITRVVDIEPWWDQGAAHVHACSPTLRTTTSITAALLFPFSPTTVGASSVTAVRVSAPLAPVKLAICSVLKGTSLAHLTTWLSYHFALGVGHAYLYINQRWADFSPHPDIEALADLARSRSAELTFIEWPFPYTYPLSTVRGAGFSHFAQSLAHNDCHLRYRGAAESLLFIDADEFVYVHPNHSLPALLDTGDDASGGGRRDCLLLPCTWGLLPSDGPPSLPWLTTSSPITAVGAEHPFRNDPHARYRQKLLVRSSFPELLGVHGMYRPHSRCQIVTNRSVTRETADPAVAGFVHLLSPALRAATAMTTTRIGKSELEAEIATHANASATAVLGASLSLRRGYCGRCVEEAPLTPVQVSQAADRAAFLASRPHEDAGGAVTAEALAYARCEALPACPTVWPTPLAVAGKRASRSDGHAGHLGALVPYPGMPSPPPLSVPLGTRLLVQGENTRGRYSNMRYALLDYLQLGLMTNRTVVAAPMGFSTTQCRESLEELYDWRHLNALLPVVSAPTITSGIPRQRLGPHCAPGGVRPIMLQNPERHGRYKFRTTSLVPSWGQWKVAGGIDWRVVPYPDRKALPRVAALLTNETCLGLSSGFWAFNFWHPDKVRLQNALRPAQRVQAVIDKFLAGRLGGGTDYVGVHMRLTDIGYSDASHCNRDISGTVRLVRQLLSTHSLRRVALATDDYGSFCAKAFFAEFPDAVAVRSGTYTPDSCSEAQFVQEVVAKSRCFIGSVNSTFSVAIEEIRTSNRARNAATPDCTYSEAAGQARFEW